MYSDAANIAHLLQFVETRITALIANSTVLTNCFSQTYGPGLDQESRSMQAAAPLRCLGQN